MASSVAIGRVRIRRTRGEDDGLRVRLGVDRLLAGADVAPGRLPPAAILVVRALADPQPGRLDVRAARPSPRWSRALSSALDEHAARAARPAAGDLRAGAGAVVFADRAELLACLAGDWAAGLLGSRWWWKTLGIGESAAVVRELGRSPEHVPAALALLASGMPRLVAAEGDAPVVAFAARVGEPEAAHLARAVARAFGVEHMVDATLAEVPVEDDEPPPAVAPWASLLGPAQRLAAAQELLAGLALALAHAPAAVRDPAFASALARWTPARRALGAAAPEDAAAPQDAAPQRPAPAAGTGARRAAARQASARRLDPRAGRHDHVAADAATDTPRQPASSPHPARPPRAPHRAPSQPASPTAVPTSPCPRAVPPLAAVAATAYGGLFHLIYVAQRIGLYGDFTAPAHPGLRLGPWDFVALVGHRLLGRPPLTADPVWALLGQLAGRPPHQAPGSGLRAGEAWRLPRGWLAPFADVYPRRAWRYALADLATTQPPRLRLVHPAGFMVVDAPGADLARELARYGISHALPGAPTRAPSAAGPRWVAHMAAYVRARLSLALGLPPAAAVRAALVRPATVAVTSTHVDVTSELADLPIEVRLSGLDRDPGFIPAAGHTLRLHFT